MKTIVVVGNYQVFKYWIEDMIGDYNNTHKTLISNEIKYIHVNDPRKVQGLLIDGLIELRGEKVDQELIDEIKLRIKYSKGKNER